MTAPSPPPSPADKLREMARRALANEFLASEEWRAIAESVPVLLQAVERVRAIAREELSGDDEVTVAEDAAIYGENDTSTLFRALNISDSALAELAKIEGLKP